MLTALNVVGMAAYLILASRGWRPTDGGEIAAEPFMWALCLPVVALFSVLDLCWGVLIIFKKATGWPLLGLVTALWLIVVRFDFAHH